MTLPGPVVPAYQVTEAHMSLLARLSLLLSLCLVPPAHAADAWTTGLHDLQLSLYRLTGTFYMTTINDADVAYVQELPATLAAYRKALAALDHDAGGDRTRAQQLAAIRAASTPVEALAGRDVQALIGSSSKRYVNNGVFDAFNLANELHNNMTPLEAAIDSALKGSGGGNELAMLRAAAGAERLASSYAELATGYFDDQSAANAGNGMARMANAFSVQLNTARGTVPATDAVRKITMDKVDTRWKFVHGTLTGPAGNKPRLVYRYLREISDNLLKLARPAS